jgi:surfeit locus 1 family protein
MEYRQVTVVGTYDHSQQIAIRNQYWDNQWGVHLVTPLVLAGSNQAILVDRGWIPSQDYQSGDWSAYDETGIIQVSGVIRASQEKADFGSRSDPTPAPGQSPMLAWNFVNVQALQQQASYQLLPAYIQQAHEASHTGLPYRTQPEVEITEGPHLSYAIQWFTFATVLVLGYPFFIRWQEKNRQKNKSIVSEAAAS